MRDDILLEIKDLTVQFNMFEGVIQAVEHLSLTVRKNRVLGIIGESGSGKSVTVQNILRILPSPPGRVTGGEILFNREKSDGMSSVVDILKLDPQGAEIRSIRGKDISMIFQEPMTSFGPLDTIGRQICEVVLTHEPDVTKKDARERAIELLRAVGIPRAEKVVDDYPHQLSGGMRQRAMIAMGLVCRPKLLLADEPTTALDVTVQAQIIRLLRRLIKEYNMTMIYITHNLAVVSDIADEVAVMYLGNLCELAPVRELSVNPKHPYTKALWKSIPSVIGNVERLYPIKGVMPSLAEVPEGCVFCSRCEEMIPGVCDGTKRPELNEISPGHFVRCFRYGQEPKEKEGA